MQLSATAGAISSQPSNPYLLDNYLTNAYAFWSKAKVTSDAVYSGALARQRVNTGGQPEYDISVASDGLFLDVADAESKAGSNSAYDVKLYNQDGSGTHDMVQSTTANQFRCINAGTYEKLNSNPVMVAGASSNPYMTCSGTTFPAGAITVIAIVAHNNGSAEYNLANASLTSNTMFNYNGTIPAQVPGMTTTNQHNGGDSGVPTNTLACLGYRAATGVTKELRVNGSVNSTWTAENWRAGGALEIGWNIFNVAPYKLCELLVWSTVLDATTIAEIEADRMAWWGIS